MRTIVQRCKYGKVSVAGETISEIGPGLLVLWGIKQGDTEEDARYLIDKIINLRIFADEFDKMNLSLLDIQGELLIISQFTLYADVKKGRRPAFTQAANHQEGETLYQYALEYAKKLGVSVKAGIYGAHMAVELLNDGPVTIVIDSPGKI